MTDKEVGALWQCASVDGCGHFSKAEVQWLIRKLVEEKTRNYIAAGAWSRDGEFYRSYTNVESLKLALRDFCIDPATWSHDA